MKKIEHDEYIKRVSIIHNNKYDYSNTTYINSRKYIKIICPIHGKFEQKAGNHMRWGCSKCTYFDAKDDFIQKSSEKFNNKYDYSLVDYKNNNTKVKIICPVHGVFEQTPSSHLYSIKGCNTCGILSSEKAKWKTECTYCNKSLDFNDRYKSSSGKILSYHKDCYKIAQKEKDLIRDYNISLNDYYNYYNNQKGCCSICKTQLELFHRNTVIDHCHNSNKVRGMLCTNCNTMIGFSKDNIETLKNAIIYLKNNS